MKKYRVSYGEAGCFCADFTDLQEAEEFESFLQEKDPEIQTYIEVWDEDMQEWMV